MQFEILYQELAHSAEMIRALTVGLTPAEARAKPNPRVMVYRRSGVPPIRYRV